jgi:hypothetical protein
MKKNIIFAILISFSFHVYCQDSAKIDSVFNLFFVCLETDDNKIITQDNDDSLCVYYEKLQVVYDFCENITGIYMKRELKNNVMYISYSDSIKKQWEAWYKINQAKLAWVEDHKRINKIDYEWFRCIDYKGYYPNQIRFADKITEIPKSTVPTYITDLEDNNHYLQPKEIDLNK